MRRTGAIAAARFWLKRAAKDLTGLEKLRAEAALEELLESTAPARAVADSLVHNLATWKMLG